VPRNVEPLAPKITAMTLPRLANADDLPESLEEYQSLRFGTVHEGDLEFTRTAFYDCHLDAVTVDTLRSTPMTLVDSEVSQPNLVTWAAANSRWHNVALHHGRIGTLDLSGSSIDTVRITGMRIGYLNLRMATLTDVEFVDCAIATIDLPGATLRRVRFLDCTTDELVVRGATSTDVDLRGLDATDFDGIEAARGVTIGERQLGQVALALAQAAGLTVLE